MKVRMFLKLAAVCVIFLLGFTTHVRGDAGMTCDECQAGVAFICGDLTDPDEWATCINEGLAECVYVDMACPPSTIGG